MLKLDNSRARFIAATISIGVAIGAVAWADEHGGVPPKDNSASTPACYTDHCSGSLTVSACYSCCNTHCDSNKQVDCQDACDSKFPHT